MNKRRETFAEKMAKRVKKECSYGDKCYRKNPAHFREFSHPHLEAILATPKKDGEYQIPEKYNADRFMLLEQLEVIVEKQLYEPRQPDVDQSSLIKDKSNSLKDNQTTGLKTNNDTTPREIHKETKHIQIDNEKHTAVADKNIIKPNRESDVTNVVSSIKKDRDENMELKAKERDRWMSPAASGSIVKEKDPDYRRVVPPTRRIEQYIKVVVPKGKMAAKHAASAPYHIFYTTIDDAPETHRQPFSITFQEILDPSLGELKCSLQINFMVEIGWLLGQYYFAGYSEKKMTILYGDDCSDLKSITKKKPHIDAHYVTMATPFGKHHTKMMILCYEDGSLRVVISTANLYNEDWENRTQGLWFSPRCPELPKEAMPFDGESPTMFKKTLLRYLHHYHLPNLAFYTERVKRCDFSHINVFLVASAPGSHFDLDWGMTRVGSLLRQHCCVPPEENRQWPLIAQASSLGSYGKDPKLWLTGDFLHHFTKIKNQSQMLSTPPQLKLIYPSLENVRQSHDSLLGGGCLPYAADAHSKQTWLTSYLYQWKATCTKRDKAMPHIKSYTRTSPDNKKAAFYLLTSGNVSKAAWGSINKGNAALRIMSYEAGVLLLPKFVINEDYFPLQEGAKNRLVIPYDIPPVKYTSDMSPWVQDYLRDNSF